MLELPNSMLSLAPPEWPLREFIQLLRCIQLFSVEPLTLAAMSAPASEGSENSDESASPDASTETATAPADETSVSADGATRLLVTAYIGIGNKLYIRGDGPGLSWDKGVPMQFVSIGKWGWASNDVTAPVACKLYKNDETAALSGEIFLEAGKHVELTALF